MPSPTKLAKLLAIESQLATERSNPLYASLKYLCKELRETEEWKKAIQSRISRRLPEQIADGSAEVYNDLWGEQPWPSLRRFVFLYNSLSPEAWSQCHWLNEPRRELIKMRVREHREEQFWVACYEKANESPGAASYNGNLEWFLHKGRTSHRFNYLSAYEGLWVNWMDKNGER